MTAGMGFPDKKVMAELTAKMLLEVDAVRFMDGQAVHLHLGLGEPGLYRLPAADLVSARAPHVDRFRRGHRHARGRFRAVRCDRGRRDRRHSVRGLDGRPPRFADALCAQEAQGVRTQCPDRRPSGRGAARAPGRGFDHRRPQQGQFLQGAARGRGQGRARAGVLLLRHLPRGTANPDDLGVTLHSLATWWDVLAVAKASGKFEAAKLAEVEKFMHDPAGWSKAHGGVAAAAAE